MEQVMKISSSIVRRLRNERGWSQEQLAIASGLSLRTIQRVEAEGVASMATKVSLAATYAIDLDQLDDADDRKPSLMAMAGGIAPLFMGVAILTCALMFEAGRLPGLPTSGAMAALAILLASIGLAAAVPTLLRLVSRGRYAGIVLAVTGTPLATIMAGGLLVAAVTGRTPSLLLVAMGASGLVLVFMALRELARAGAPSLQESRGA
jgi:transcriptional regulator with XRE-family HTH domain